MSCLWLVDACQPQLLLPDAISGSHASFVYLPLVRAGVNEGEGKEAEFESVPQHVTCINGPSACGT